jgi:hypothetical protein
MNSKHICSPGSFRSVLGVAIPVLIAGLSLWGTGSSLAQITISNSPTICSPAMARVEGSEHVLPYSYEKEVSVTLYLNGGYYDLPLLDGEALDNEWRGTWGEAEVNLSEGANIITISDNYGQTSSATAIVAPGDQTWTYTTYQVVSCQLQLQILVHCIAYPDADNTRYAVYEYPGTYLWLDCLGNLHIASRTDGPPGDPVTPASGEIEIGDGIESPYPPYANRLNNSPCQEYRKKWWNVYDRKAESVETSSDDTIYNYFNAAGGYGRVGDDRVSDVATCY